MKNLSSTRQFARSEHGRQVLYALPTNHLINKPDFPTAIAARIKYYAASIFQNGLFQVARPAIDWRMLCPKLGMDYHSWILSAVIPTASCDYKLITLNHFAADTIASTSLSRRTAVPTLCWVVASPRNGLRTFYLIIFATMDRKEECFTPSRRGRSCFTLALEEYMEQSISAILSVGIVNLDGFQSLKFHLKWIHTPVESDSMVTSLSNESMT
mmetsp:Transcript_26141/g.54089  ORF Transcript_26141/g.54089 Transcript_26141/m.54089 type:complete len:213 (-) Transcript_26141:169-807(-)